MTENTAPSVSEREVQPLPFLFALLLAPLTVGLPAWGLLWLGSQVDAPGVGLLIIAAFPAVAVVLGAPTYLLLGGPAFWFALKRNMSIPLTALSTNFVSLPLVAGLFALLPSAWDIGTTLLVYGGLGSIFAPMWGAIFFNLYNRFRRA